MAHENILTTLGINLKDYGIAFDSMARAVDRNYQGQSILARFDSEEFWTSAKLKNWLLACYETLCHGVWHTPIPISERVQLMDYALYILPCVSTSLSSIKLGNSVSVLHRIWLHTHVHSCGDRLAMNFGKFVSF
jgi:hypothetical protein